MLRQLLLSALLCLSVASAQLIPTPFPFGRTVGVRRFAKIPNHYGQSSKIVSTVHFGGNLYVCTSTSGGKIYKVTPTGQVSLFFNAAGAMGYRGAPMDSTNKQHGGLRSVAFHPNYAQNGLLYISVMQKRTTSPNNLRYFSRPSSNLIPADSVVLEFRYSNKYKKVLASSMRTVIRFGMPVYDHPIKQIAFKGPYLYIAHGDGSVQSATAGGGQRNDGLGKILRINPLKSGNNPYTIPSSNPFLKTGRWKNELYAVGFRNPHNMCFSKSGELFVTDAGRDNFEEINLVKAGGNYGWSQREGTFVHKQSGGITNGVAKLPWDDAKFGFEYPVVQIEHIGPIGAGFVGQALAGGCPIENGSFMSGTMLYTNFPTDGALYYSFLGAMRRAKTKGSPGQLSQAKTYTAKIAFDHDNNPNTKPLFLKNLRDVIRKEPGKGSSVRSDIRFGQGPSGEIYFSSKVTGWIYLITSTKP